mmetsp:Transcript_45250/g.110181  ORF Transcript_45250/g.110181 Transcript_45250/m.110181 type:complete len:392 (+) Transcript_45250:33-1208(+)|eukprot:CAMPEP_0206246378 /NCGR_PEP_ID=MMETSP0047_2-20121206/19221_1 /ASSEMBLY_ACC=CAM_ASM_000192 /TAXON_ID=195065 /ORGANISM="Chroomonas mesostigmatica_cf, Strain CCMP1168" /LENGTH=391 /DNA_ID=CAMNT_0053671785 /DNA_START=21 /DNA_END=1196 /DNA_ORIENTATION=-
MNGNYQLTNVEAQRVMAVLDDLAFDLRLAFRLTPQALSSIGDISSVVGQENERYFVMQVELEKQFSVLAAQLEGPVSEFVADAENDTQDAVVHDFFDVARRLRKNTREICRFLRRNLALDRKLQGVPQQMAPLAERFLVVLDNLKAQTLRSLGTSVEEDKSEKEHFENVSVREKTLTEQERMLTKDLATVKRDREKAVKARDAQIASLEAEKAELQQMTANAGKAVGEGKNQNEKTEHGAEIETLQKKLKKLQDDLAKTKLDNRDKEEGLKKRSYKKETDVETWVQKYDQEMGALNEEAMTLSETYIAEKAKMRRLENHFEAFKLVEGAEFALSMMQMANELEVAAKAKRLADAATLIQSSLRGHKGRDAFGKAKKKGGKKGKGKGGKKKK